MTRQAWLVIPRLAGAGLLAATAYIHLKLWHEGYRSIATIGPLFLTCGISAIVLAVAVLATRRRLLSVSALAAAGLEAGTVIGLWITTTHGLFGFRESSQATDYWPSVAVEIAGAVTLLVLAVLALERPVGRSAATMHVRQATAGR